MNIIVIPARYGSSRFPGKPLAKILNKPMIQWVYERSSMANGVDAVYVATDDERIYDCVLAFGGQAIMTGECKCGTDRIYQAIKNIECDIVVNVQGDEPLINPKQIELLLSAFQCNDVVMATLKERIYDREEIYNPNVVKVVSDINENAVYFSRAPIPFSRDGIDDNSVYFRHVGIYAYRKNFLDRFVDLPISNLEEMEKLEQLRAIENGYPIRILETDFPSIGIDTPDQITEVEEYLIKMKREM